MRFLLTTILSLLLLTSPLFGEIYFSILNSKILKEIVYVE